MNMPQAWMKAKMPTAASALPDSGAMIRRMIHHSAGAVDARRLEELGRDGGGDVLAHQEDAERHEQIGQDDALIGVDPVERDELEIERDHVASNGTIAVASIRPNRKLRPGKRYFAKIAPATSEVSATEAVADERDARLLRKKRPNGAASNAPV